MSFLNELKKQKDKLKGTETVVTNMDGKRFVDKGENRKNILPNTYGFVIDTKPDDIPVLITDYLYIGSQDCAASNILENYNIKHVLSVGIDIEVTADHKFVECLDLPDTDILPVLKDCLPFINEAVSCKENILVHCNAGVSRTSMVAIAYLMQYNNVGFDNAYEFVKNKRPAVQPNVGFKKQLKSFVPGKII